MKTIRSLFFFGALLHLTSCHLGPRYTLPEVNIPEEWKTTNAQYVQSESLEHWWDVFHDTYLDCLEKQAIANNPNLTVAFERVMEARAIAQATQANLYPQITLDPSYTDQGSLMKNYFSGLFPNPAAAQKKAQQASNLSIPKAFRLHQYQIQLPLDLSYEVDLWGKLQGQYKAALFNAQAQSDAYLTTLLTLTTDLASTYFQARTLDSALDLYKDTIRSYQTNLNLAKLRYEKGLVTQLDVAEAELQLTNTEATYLELMRQRRLLENLIATLIGIPASTFHLGHQTLREIPPVIPAGIPSDLLKQRPDIAQAERQMASQHALIGVAYASFYPSLSLTAAAGFLSPIFKEFLTWSSRFWQMGANASETIFDGGRNDANLAAAYARFREASGSYQQVILNAFQEVEDALNNIELYTKAYERVLLSANASTQAYQITSQQNLRGLVNYLNVVQTEVEQLTAKSKVIDALGNRYQATIQLIKALGGSWEYELSYETSCLIKTFVHITPL